MIPYLKESKQQKSAIEAKHETNCLGSPLTEAFAILQLQINYFAWLLEGKQKFKSMLVTDYDREQTWQGKIQFCNALLEGVKLDQKIIVTDKRQRICAGVQQ